MFKDTINNFIWKIYLFIMCIGIPIYLSIIKFKKNKMNIIGSIIYYIVCIIIIFNLYILIKNESYNAMELLLVSSMLYIFYILYLISLVHKNNGIQNFNNDDRNISISIIVSIILIEYLFKGNFNKSIIKNIMEIIKIIK
jgi:succinate dehydrogenase hydrophobic anchor subunit